MYRLFAVKWRPLVSVVTTLYYLRVFFVLTCFLCAVHVFEVRASSSPLGYLCAKFRFFRGLCCRASPWRKIVYSITHSITHSITQSVSLFDACASEQEKETQQKWLYQPSQIPDNSVHRAEEYTIAC